MKKQWGVIGVVFLMVFGVGAQMAWADKCAELLIEEADIKSSIATLEDRVVYYATRVQSVESHLLDLQEEEAELQDPGYCQDARNKRGCETGRRLKLARVQRNIASDERSINSNYEKMNAVSDNLWDARDELDEIQEAIDNCLFPIDGDNDDYDEEDPDDVEWEEEWDDSDDEW